MSHIYDYTNTFSNFQGIYSFQCNLTSYMYMVYFEPLKKYSQLNFCFYVTRKLVKLACYLKVITKSGEYNVISQYIVKNRSHDQT